MFLLKISLSRLSYFCDDYMCTFFILILKFWYWFKIYFAVIFLLFFVTDYAHRLAALTTQLQTAPHKQWSLLFVAPPVSVKHLSLQRYKITDHCLITQIKSLKIYMYCFKRTWHWTQHRPPHPLPTVTVRRMRMCLQWKGVMFYLTASLCNVTKLETLRCLIVIFKFKSECVRLFVNCLITHDYYWQEALTLFITRYYYASIYIIWIMAHQQLGQLDILDIHMDIEVVWM